MFFKASLLFLLALVTSIFASPLESRNPPETCQICIPSPNNCDITAPCSNFLGKLWCGWYVLLATRPRISAALDGLLTLLQSPRISRLGHSG